MGAVAWCKTASNQTSRLMAKGANMNGNPKAASTQESIAFHFDFADATDPAERERLLMEELCRTQSALAEADIEIRQKQRALAERAFEQEAADARVFCTPPAGPLISMSKAIP